MFLLLRLSLRNLFRQKRRNLFLGSAMAIGVMLLVIANSFSHGISDIMLNKVLRWITGHVTIASNERGRMDSAIFRDKAVFDFIKTDYKDIVREEEEAIGVLVKGIGNGTAENLIFVGTDMSSEVSEKSRKETEESFQMVEGQWNDLTNPKYQNPVIISEDKLKSLKLKRFDVLRLRFRNIFGQDQSARVTVVGTIKTSNIFMGPVTFGDLKTVKTLLGYDEHSIGYLNLILKDPNKNARKLADTIHARLKNPGLAIIAGTANDTNQTVTLLGFNSNAKLETKWAAQVELLSGSLTRARQDKTALVAQPLAQALNLRIGNAFTVTYTDKWNVPGRQVTVKVGGIFKPGKNWGPNVVLMQDERFYEAFYGHWPQQAESVKNAFIPKNDHPAYDLLSPQWILLPRTTTTEELEKKMKSMGKNKWRSTIIDVQTMYETGEKILKLEGVLNLITLVMVLVLFFIILIGVINTLRMTIRERTREIGTVRAIGMQSKDVRNLFITETLLLSIFSSIAGVLLAFLAMVILSHIPMRNMTDNPMGMFLVNSRLYFIPSWTAIVGNMLFIWILACATAYFPARRAAKLSPGAALRHVE